MRFRSLLIVLAAFSTQTAAAASLAGAKCESKELISIMEKQLKNAAFAHGVHVEGISKSVTDHSSRSKLICVLTLRASYSGQSMPMRVRMVYEQFSDGELAAKLMPY